MAFCTYVVYFCFIWEQKFKKLLKVKEGKNKFYNELNDIYFVLNFHNFRSRLKGFDGVVLKIITFDKALMAFIEEVLIKMVDYADIANGESTFYLDYQLGNTFFPEMEKEQFESYCNIN